MLVRCCEKWKLIKPATRAFLIATFTLVILLVTSTIGVHVIKAKTQEEDNPELDRQEQVAQEENENSFTEEGTTSMGTVLQLPDFATNVVTIYVEEVYVEAGSTVAEGDALLKITADSLEEAKAYYVKTVAAAEDALKEAKLAYESGKLEAEYEKKDAQLNAEGAEAFLETALQEQQEEIDEKYEKWQETVDKINAYKDNLYNDIYYKNAGVEEKTTAVTDASVALENAQAAYDTAAVAYETAQNQLESDISKLSVAASSNEDMTGIAANIALDYETLKAAEAVYDEKSTEFETAKRNLQNATAALEQAKLLYEKNIESANNSLEQLETSVDALRIAYETANREAEVKQLELKKEYETTILEGEYAQANYDAAVETLETAVTQAEDLLEDLKEEQKALLSLENGVICASQGGTLANVTYEAGDMLLPETALVTYYDTSEIMISVEVEQENIAKLTVGDEVSVSVSGNRRGTVTGKVASIATSATTGGSVSDVTYTVVISIDNEKNTMSAGLSATVTFDN